MRIVLAILFTASLFSSSRAFPGEPAEESQGRIAALIEQLGSEEYAVRERATELLKKADLAAMPQLEAASLSSDLEVRRRVRQLLTHMARRAAQPAAQRAQEDFNAAMKEAWPAALKEGRLCGPLLGCVKLNAKPRAVDEKVYDITIPVEGLGFLRQTQSADGRWQAFIFGAQTPADVEQTSLALLAFLGSGHTEKEGEHKQTARNAISWLKARQRNDGAVLNEGWTQVDSVAHALATMALSEAAGMANIPDTKAAAQRAIDFAIRLQDERSGGFGRAAGVCPDLFSTTMHVMALKSARVAGLNVPDDAFKGLIRFLDSVEDKEAKSYRFIPDGKASARAAIMGVVCRHFLGWKRWDLRETAAVAMKTLGKPTVDREDSDAMTNYFGMIAAYQQGGEIWKNWSEPFKKAASDARIREGPARGAWAPKGDWAGGGYILSTSMNALALRIMECSTRPRGER